MDERQIEQALYRLKDTIPVNEELKVKLRASFQKRQRYLAVKRWGVAAAAAVLLLGTLMLRGPDGVRTVEAQSLLVQNQVSFVDLGSGSPLGVSEHQGTVYVPVAGKGLFAYDSTGFHRLLEREVNEAAINPDGNRFILESGGTLGTYDKENGQYKEILKSDGTTLFYEQPSWKDDKTILYVKKVMEPQDRGFIIKESGIYEMNLDSGETKKLEDGSSPSYVNGRDAIVFQKDTEPIPHIILKELGSGQETVIDQGRFPAVSPEGTYIAYVKSETSRRELKPNVFAEETVDQIWISDSDGKTKRVVTANTPNQQIDEQEWLQGVEPGDIPQTLGISGLYSYYNPVWSSDSQSLYMLKGRNAEGSKMSIARIDFSTKALEAEETVRAFNQAKILRDLDFARSLLKNDQDFVIPSNPHQVSYLITGSGMEDNRPYVDVEENRAYTANPDYSVSYVRYYLVTAGRGYLIDETKSLPGGTSIQEQPDGTIAMQSEDGTKESILSKESIPQELRPAGDYRISSLAYAPKRDEVVFTLQVLQDPDRNQTASVKVMVLDLKSRTFKLLEQVSTLNGMSNIGVSNVTVSPDGRYAALDLFSDDDPAFGSHILAMDLEQESSLLLESKLSDTDEKGTHTYYWDRDQLHFILTSQGQEMHYKWNAAAGTFSRP